MAFRYENAGDGADMLTTVTALDVDKTKSLTGKAFYQTQRVKCFDLPATAEVWLKFDVYFDGTNRWRAYNGETGKSDGITVITNGNLEFYANGKSDLVYTATGACTANQLQTVLLHMISGSSAGVIEAWVDGNFIYRYTGDVNHGEDFADLYLQSDGAGTLFSNIIVSDSEIHMYEGANSSSFDVETHIYNGLRGWRYFNAGDADLLATSGGTTVNVGYDKSVTGKAFYGGGQVDMFNTPELSEVWMRFDMYYNADGAINNYDRRVACGFYSNTEGRYIGFTNIYSGGRNSTFRLTSNISFSVPHDFSSFNQCLLHIKCGAPGCVELTISGNTITYTGTVNAGQPTDTLYLYCDNSYCIFSNVTVSDTPLTMDEGYRRDLFTAETEVTAPVLNVRWQGENHQFYLTTKKTTPALAVHVGDKNFYAPIVNDDDALASAVRLLLDDTNRALKT